MMGATNTKKYLTLLLGVLIVGGVAFGFSQTGLLQGKWGIESAKETVDIGANEEVEFVDVDVEDLEEYSEEKADELYTEIQKWSDYADVYYGYAKDRYDDFGIYAYEDDLESMEAAFDYLADYYDQIIQGYSYIHEYNVQLVEMSQDVAAAMADIQTAEEDLLFDAGYNVPTQTLSARYDAFMSDYESNKSNAEKYWDLYEGTYTGTWDGEYDDDGSGELDGVHEESWTKGYYYYEESAGKKKYCSDAFSEYNSCMAENYKDSKAENEEYCTAVADYPDYVSGGGTSDGNSEGYSACEEILNGYNDAVDDYTDMGTTYAALQTYESSYDELADLTDYIGTLYAGSDGYDAAHASDASYDAEVKGGLYYYDVAKAYAEEILEYKKAAYDVLFSASTQDFGKDLVSELRAGVSIVESGTTFVTEGSEDTDSYTVVLDSAPTSGVDITLTPDAQITVSPSVLSFSTSDWSTSQTVTVSAVADTLTEGLHTGVIQSAAVSTDSNYDGIAISDVTVSVNDPEDPVETADPAATTDPAATEDPAELDGLGTLHTDSDDADEDFLADIDEIKLYGTDPTDEDSDDDGFLDGEEVDLFSDPLDASSTPSLDDPTVEEILGDPSYVCEDPFEDMHGHWAEDMACRLFHAGILQGRTLTTFVPNDYITRAEWIKIIDLTFGHLPSEVEGIETEFLDVTEADWFYYYVVLAEQEGVARISDRGSDFHPNDYITRGDAILYAIRMARQTSYDYDVESIFTDVKNDDYYAYAIAIAYETMVTTGDGSTQHIVEGYEDDTFKPENPLARSEAIAIAIRIALAFSSVVSE